MRSAQRLFRHRLLPLALSVLLFAPSGLRAQHTTGDLQIIVTDTLGESIPGVNVVVTGTNVLGVRGASTDNRGICNILALPPGTIALRLTHAAYQSVVVNDVLIQLGDTTRIDV